MWSTSLFFLLTLLVASSVQLLFKGGPVDPKVIAQKFLVRLERSIDSKDEDVIRGLFNPNFSFRACFKTYKKKEVVRMLVTRPENTPVSFHLESASFRDQYVLKCVVSTTGLKKVTQKMELRLNIFDQQLEQGSFWDCPLTPPMISSLSFAGPPSTANDLFGRGNNAFVGYSARQTLQDVPISPKDLVGRFLAMMIEFVDAKNPIVMEDLFLKNFIFKGCSALYNREETIEMLMMIPQGSRFTFNVTSVRNVGASIRADVVITGLMHKDVPFKIVFNKKEQKLENAEYDVCPGKRKLAASEDTNSVITKFLGILKQTLATHDSTVIERIFDENFVFKGCHGSYNKAKSTAKILQIPSNADFDLTLKTSNWNSNGQIECTVTISGALRDRFDAQFVYCPYKNVLKSGSISSCPAKGTFVKPCIDEFGQFC